MSEQEPLILVVDDDDHIRKAVRVYLEAQHYAVAEVLTAGEAITFIGQYKPNLVILDLELKEDLSAKGGLEVSKWVRFEQGNYTLPIIVLSSNGSENIVEESLDAGADDFVKKPFDASQLMARIRAALRRATPQPQTPNNPDQIQMDGLTIDVKQRRAYVDGRDIKLTRTEFALLGALAEEKDRVLSHDELLSRVWGDQYQDAIHYLHVYLGRIRKKMGERQNLLETAPGMGYVLHSKLPHDAKSR